MASKTKTVSKKKTKSTKKVPKTKVVNYAPNLRKQYLENIVPKLKLLPNNEVCFPFSW